MYLFVENDSFVGVYSAIKSLELFYIVRIIEKCVAVEDICDIYGHHVQCGANYLKGYYLEKSKEKGDKIFYKQRKKVVYIYPREIFCPAVSVSSELTLLMTEYLFLSDAV